MVDAKEELVRGWLKKAADDLDVAKKLGVELDCHFDAAAFHCQQAAEKALKGFLLHHGIEFGKTHDILELIESVLNVRPDFQSFLKYADELTPHAVAGRYPGDELALSKEDFQEILKMAQEILDSVQSVLS